MKAIKTAFAQSLDSVPTGTFNISGSRLKMVDIKIVGSVHMGVEPYRFTGPITIEPEPTNPHDKNALLVKDGDTHIGYIPKDKQHYFKAEFKQTASWTDVPKALNTSDKWSIQLLMPA